VGKRIPDVFVIVFCLIIIAAVLTWFVPGGSFERREEKVGEQMRKVLVKGSFEYGEAHPQTVEIFTAPMRGFLKLGEIVAFIFLVGGAFFILNESGAIAAGTRKMVSLLKGREFLIIPIVMTFFSFFGAAFGMCEEAMPFVLIFVPLAIALGYDSIVGVSLTFLAAGVGFAGAFLNPFTLQIAQGISGLQPISGWEYRVLVWLVCTGLAIAWVMVYAARIRKKPELSPMREIDKEWRDKIERQMSEGAAFTKRHGICLLLLLATIGAMIWGVIALNWYIVELGGLFFAMGLGPNQIAKSFIAGVKEMAGAALIVGFAGGIIIVLEDGNIMDTILFGISRVTEKMPPLLTAHSMYVVQMFINFFIPSGSTKAALTMPLFAPLADLAGITRQTAVLAYQFGDGFTNMIIPTSGVTVGTLTMAKIPFEKWFKWHWPMQVAFFVLSLTFLVWPVMAHWE
jgi:uncharacterized ion transporter superfamily protein YfcC